MSAIDERMNKFDRWGHLPQTGDRPFAAYFTVADNPVRPAVIAVKMSDFWIVRMQPYPGVNAGARFPVTQSAEEVIRECEATLIESGMVLGEWRRPSDAERVTLFDSLINFRP